MNQCKPSNPNATSQDRERDAVNDANETGDLASGAEDAVQRAIGSQLRAVYDEVVNMPVPDKFLALLSSLDGKTASRSGSDLDKES